VAAPAYLESNGRVAIPSRLRPATGGTLEVIILPRPPLSTATLANANQTQVVSISWLDDDGTGHQEPLWLASAPPASSGVVEVDRYGGTFARARAAFNIDAGTHAFTFMLAATAGPGGAALADTAELRAMGGVVWFDHNGTLGHVKGTDGNDAPVDAIAGMIDAHTLMGGTVDTTTDPAHPALLLEVPAAARRRATLGDLVQGLNDYIITLVEVNPSEIDITGAVPVPAPEPPAPHDRTNLEVYAAVADLQKVLGGIGGQDEARCSWALIAASYTVDAYLGRSLPTDLVTDPAVTVVASTGGVRQATLALAARFYKNPENWSGMLAPDTVGAYVSRYVADLDLYLMGQRERFGIA
jgi:hypothetical protein